MKFLRVYRRKENLWGYSYGGQRGIMEKGERIIFEERFDGPAPIREEQKKKKKKCADYNRARRTIYRICMDTSDIGMGSREKREEEKLVCVIFARGLKLPFL